MDIGLVRVLGLVTMLAATRLLCGEQITSTCRISAVDAAIRTVTLVRMTASGEKAGRARVADDARIAIDGKPAPLDSLLPPVSATVIFDTESRALVSIQVFDDSTADNSEPPIATAPFDAAKAKECQEAWAEHLGVPAEVTNSVGMKLVLIPPGEFDMGSSQSEIDILFKKACPVGIRVPRRYYHRLPLRRFANNDRRVCLVRHERRQRTSSCWEETAQSLAIARYERKRVRMVC